MSNQPLAQEILHPEEGILIREMIDAITKSLRKDYRKSPMLRRFHAKSTGLAKGLFCVNENLSTDFQQGLFKHAKSYPCYVRFSNGASALSSDHSRGVRGMAIKVMELDQSPVMEDECGNTQDFLLTNNPVLFPGTLEAQHLGIMALFDHWRHAIGLLKSSRLSGICHFIRSMVAPDSVLNLRYFSGTPYLFGPGKAVKWAAFPLQLSGLVKTSNSEFLRENLLKDLLRDQYHFEFGIQQQINPKKEPIENAGVIWKTSFIKLATIIIEKQHIDHNYLPKIDKMIHFSPWHCLTDHRPLGGPNRFRKEYSTFMKLRENQEDKYQH